MDNIQYGPADVKGRDLKGEGYTWVYVTAENKNMYCKVESSKINDIHEGKPFLAYNPWARGADGNFIYLPSIFLVIEPLFIVKASTVAIVHYLAAQDLDKMSQQAFSEIVLAKENDVPKTPPKLIKV